MTVATTAARLGGTAFVPLAWRNLVANRRRLLRSSAGIGFAVLLMLVQLGFERGFFDASLAMVRQLDGDLFIFGAGKYRFFTRDPFPPRHLAEAAKVAGVASVAPGYAAWQEFFWQPPHADQPYLVQVFAFDPGHPVVSLPDATADTTKLAPADTVIVDRLGRDFLGMADGAGEAAMNGRKVRIVGSFALGPDFMSDGTVVMGAETFARLSPGNRDGVAALPVEFAAIRLRPDARLADVQQALAAALGADLRVMSKAQIVDFERAFQADLSSAGPIFWLGTLVGFVVGMLISYQIIYTDLSDQLPQYATLKGMGYRTGYLMRIVLEQAALSALAGYLPAWLLCLLVYRAIGAVTLLPLHMTWQLTLLSLSLTLGMCLVSAALAIRRVVSADPAEVF